jgi:glycosyltransferase involved in cell wall biosynthesis
MREVPEAHVVILGRGSYEAELRSLATRLGVSDRVTIGHVEPADRQGMAVALAEASVVAAFSDYEAHPVAVMEALGIGRPVVGYATAGIGELVEEGLVHGVKPGASAPDAAADLVRAMVQQDAQTLPEMPTWDTTAQELAAVYRQVLRTRQPVSVRGAAS